MSKTTEVLSLTKEVIDSNDKLQTFIEKAKSLTIPLLPETIQFADSSLKYGLALVSVDLKLDQYGNNRDIYKNSDGTYCLHLSKTNEIRQQSGLQIVDSRPIERKVDENGQALLIIHQVKGRLRSVDGSIKEDVATGKYDYFRDKAKYLKRDGSEITGMINSRRAHAEAIAESNAMTRLFNKMLAKLPSGFTLDELKKPFLVPYVLEDKDELIKDLPADEQVKLKIEVARKRLGLANDIYPASPVSPVVPEYQAPINNDYKPDTSGKPEPEEAQIVEEQTGIDKAEENKILAKEFRQTSQKERTEKILTLIKLKDYKDPNGIAITVSRIEKQSLDNQIIFIEKLLNLSDSSEEAPL